MSTMTDSSDPRKRSFADEIKELSTKTLLERQRDIDIFVQYGMYPDWAVYEKESKYLKIKSILDYWEMEDIFRYRIVLNMELLDRCDKFELYPKLNFFFNKDQLK